MDWNRILSGLLAGAYLVIAFIAGGIAASLKMMIGIIMPLACIWFGDEMGQYRGTIRLQAMTCSTPGYLVRAGGWLILLLPIIIAIVMIMAGP